MRPKVARIILGECTDTGSDRHLCQVVMPKGAESLRHGSFAVSLYQPKEHLYLQHLQAEYSVRGSEILIVEPINGGELKSYLMLSKSSAGLWEYRQGVVALISNGWLAQESMSGKGKVIFDHANTLDKILDAGGHIMEEKE